MSHAIIDLGLALPPAHIIYATSGDWQVVCTCCDRGTRPRRLISEALNEWRDHIEQAA